MLVTTMAHAKLVKQRIEKKWAKYGRRYIVWDTETQRQRRYKGDKDALVIGRADATFIAICYRGESYSFPTSYFGSKYPSPEEWGRFFADWFEDQSIIKVMHNANYDLNIGHYSMDIRVIPNIWCTMIGAWKASEYKENGLKERAPQYGRYWRETKTVDFSNLDEVSEYAEQDVIQTDEMFQMQFYCEVDRPESVWWIKADGKLVEQKATLPAGKFVIKDETLKRFDKTWLQLLELPVLRATIRAERRGFPFNTYELYRIRQKLNSDLRDRIKVMYRMAGRLFNLNASKQIGDIATELGVDNPYKTPPSKKFPKGQVSWGAEVLVKLKGVHPFIDALIAYKELAKLSSVYIGTKPLDVDDYPEVNQSGLEYYQNTYTGAIHANAGTVNAITGRGSSSNPNLQQIPSRKDKYGVKNCFTAVPASPHVIFVPKYRRDKKLIVLDYSQLEIRIMALLCKDPTMTKVLADPKGDIHQYTADEFGVSRDPQAKNLNFLLLYGGGAYMLSETLTFFGVPTSKTVAAEYIEIHKKVYSRVPEYRHELVIEHSQTGRVKLFTGRTRSLKNNKGQDTIDYTSDRQVHKAETQLSNNVVQGSGQDFLKASIVRADYNCINPDAEIIKAMNLPVEHKLYLKDKAKQLPKLRKTLKSAECKFIIQVHDEAIYTVHPSAAEECMNVLANIMSWRHYFPSTSDYNVPLVAEGGVGDTWKQAKSKDKSLFHTKAGFEDWMNYAK